MSEQLSTTPLVSVLRELREITESSLQIPEELRTEIDEEIGKLSANEFYLVVLGQFKRGKTTLINALLGEEFLPSGILPLTAIVTFIRYGETRSAEVIFNDRRRQRIDVREMKKYISEQENPNNALNVRYVEVHHPSTFLKDGIVLIDTPGVGSTALHNTAAAKEFIPRVDAAIVVTAVDPIITQVEYEFLAELSSTVHRFFLILNKVDTLSQQETKEALSYTQNILQRALGNEANVYPVSALNALRKSAATNSSEAHQQEEYGLGKVKADIARYLSTEKTEDFVESSKRRVQRLLDQVRFHVELSQKAVEMPLLDLQKKIELFHQFINELARERNNYSHIMNGEISELKHWIADEAESHQVKETSSLKKTLVHWLNSNTKEITRKEMEQLESVVLKNLIDDTEQWRRSLQSDVIQRYDNIVSASVRMMNSYVERIVHHSASLFNISVEPLGGAEKISSAMDFSYKVHDDPLFLEIDTVKLALAFLPRTLARRLTARRIEKMIEEKVRLNCGRVQADFVGKIDEHFRQFGYQFSETVEKTTAAINTILEQAVKQKSSDESSQAEIVRRYHNQLDALTHLLQLLEVSTTHTVQ